MGIKTLIDDKGVHSESVPGNDSLVINVRTRRQTQNFAADAGGAITKPVAVFEAPTAGLGVTGTLPPVSGENIGLEITVINADVTADLLISASTGNVIDSGTLLFNVTEESATFLAVSSSLDGFSWIVTSNKA